jgi:hypothetical protein
MINQELINADIITGDQSEARLKPRIEKHLSVNLTKLDKYNPFDFVDHKAKIYVEVKTINCSKGYYECVMLGANKIAKALDHIENGYMIYLVFELSDAPYIYEFTKENFNSKNIRVSGRTDRGKDERKDYYFIHHLDLFPLK